MNVKAQAGELMMRPTSTMHADATGPCVARKNQRRQGTAAIEALSVALEEDACQCDLQLSLF